MPKRRYSRQSSSLVYIHGWLQNFKLWLISHVFFPNPITYDKEFGETFKFNQQIIESVMKLVKQVYGGERVDLPANVGDFGTAESAKEGIKPFKGEKIVSNR